MWFAYVLGGAALLGTAVMIFAVRKSGEKRAALKAFAEAQGWQFDYVPAKGRDPGSTTILDPGGDWILRIMSNGSGLRYEWSCPVGALDEGTAVLGPPLPPRAVEMMTSGGALGKGVLKAGVQQTIAALGHAARTLDVDETRATHPGGVVMASAGQADAMDAVRDAAELKMARVGRNEAQQPIILRDTDGLKVRRVGALRSLEELRDMVALGMALRAYMPVPSGEMDWS